MAELTDEQIQRIATGAVKAALAQTTRLSREDASELVAAAAHKAVHEAHVELFAHLGYDMANKDDLKRLRLNLDFMESLRNRCDRIGQSVSGAIANSVTMAILALLALGAWFWLRGAGPSSPPPSIGRGP